MKVKVVAGSTLAPSQIEAWRRIQNAHAHLNSPFYTPEFTQHVARASPDVEVAVLEKRGEIVGFFPYQRGTFGRDGLLGSTLDALGMACPVGRNLSDYHGLIAAPNIDIDAGTLLRACSLTVWDFDHLNIENKIFADKHRSLEQMSVMDLSMGFDAIVDKKTAAGSQQFVKWARQARVLERDFGPLRFVAQSTDTDALRHVLAMKSEQYIALGTDDLFAQSWVRTLVEGIHKTSRAEFAGQLSLLYAGDTLVAGHFGLRSKDVLHYWFPVYAKAFAKYSPGIVLLIKLAQYASANGIKRIDIGTGQDRYKEQFRTHTIPLAVGSVHVPSLISLYRAVKRAAVPSIRATTATGVSASALVRFAEAGAAH
jgi:CelD/BcsL family acetyltransferase involved in cellulose biosynthesis